MSRTYRKNPRWIEKYQGEFYNNGYSKDVSVKYPFTLKDGYNLPQGSAWFQIEVKVGDGDNLKNYYGLSKDRKHMHHKIDRARYKHALLINEDTHISPSFDPWDWD